MNRILSFFFALFALVSQAQSEKPERAPIAVKYPVSFGETPALRDIPQAIVLKRKKYSEVPNKFRRNTFTNSNALPAQNGGIELRAQIQKTPSIQPIQNWEGMNFLEQGVAPPDPSGAAGKEHYVQMVNTAMQVFDKQGNSLLGPTSLSSVFPGSENDGDPIVMYDKYADRWFISQFQVADDKILIAISKTPDPTGAWYYYEYALPEFPDYPKYSIWHDGYYMTANVTNPTAFVFERDAMLAGNPSARLVSKSIPDVSTGGFYSISPAHCDGNTLVEQPINLFYFYDDGWGLRSGNDAIDIWEFSVDWANTSNSTITKKQMLDVAPFSSEFDSNWDDVEQKGTSQKIDAVPGAFMYMGQFRAQNGYNSMMLCHTIDVDNSAATRAGVRWYELREIGGVWSVYQYEDYTISDGQERFMGGVAMDRKGNIGLAYSLSGSNHYPSLRFTGRLATDGTGSMTVDESVAVNGTGFQSSTNRFGDYAQMTIDPVDGLTFWYTGEFMTDNGWSTQIFSFRLAAELPNDLGVIKVVSPQDGDLTNQETVTVWVKNWGNNAVTNFDIGYRVDQNVVNETYPGTLNPGDTLVYTFVGKADLSQEGINTIIAYSDLGNDADRANDTLTYQVNHLLSMDVGVSSVVSPVTQVGLTNQEVVEVTVSNYGWQTISNIPVCYVFNGNTVCETVAQSIAGNSSVSYSFATPIDVSAISNYQLTAYTKLAGDGLLINDTSKHNFQNQGCNPTSDCTLGDEIQMISFGGVVSNSGCSATGYSNFTDSVMVVGRLDSVNFSIEVGYDDHFVSIWIDYNDNLVFEDDEKVLSDFSLDYSGSTKFFIPDTAPLGQHLCRIRTVWDSSSDSPCGYKDFGETEDYTVEIVLESGSEEVVLDWQVQVVNDPTTNLISINSAKANDEVEVSVFNSLGQIMTTLSLIQGSGSVHVDASSWAKGIYWVKLSSGSQNLTKQVVVR